MSRVVPSKEMLVTQVLKVRVKGRVLELLVLPSALVLSAALLMFLRAILVDPVGKEGSPERPDESS